MPRVRGIPISRSAEEEWRRAEQELRVTADDAS
jgi:hypothetical protein